MNCNNKRNKVCMISCRHNLLDDRIFKKEALSLSESGYPITHIGYGKDFSDYQTEENIRIIQLQKLNKKDIFRSFSSFWKQFNLNDLFEKAKETEADIYHLHDVELCRIALKLKNLPWNPKVIYDAHEPFSDNLKDYWRKRSLFRVLFNDIPSVIAEKKVLPKLDYLITTEKNVASRFLKKNPKTKIVYNYSYFQPTETEKDMKKEYDMIYCGSIMESKGLFLMLDTIALTKKKGFELKCILVGGFSDFKEEKKTKEIIRQKKLENNIVFTGEISIDEIEVYYQKSKAAFCLFPLNRTNQLILPIKLFEYASFGLPVIGSNFGHIKEFIESNNVGITVDPHNTDVVASAVIRLIEGDKYKEYTSQCINCVKEKYLWQNEKSKLLEIYNELTI